MYSVYSTSQKNKAFKISDNDKIKHLLKILSHLLIMLMDCVRKSVKLVVDGNSTLTMPGPLARSMNEAPDSPSRNTDNQQFSKISNK